ncbi:general odorant-binding protein 56d [Aedes albopictus]|uniref:Uncharacterized protein n=1 Tax=Aedes albopictus TaxID=7160 RepID=A0ABM1XX02_AEDAL|nr:general odorant-binding protein 56d-like [Aedes albopictus]XP_029713500.1 general odorant-binding protein 56d-like [Aedes albopictus]
MRQSLGDSCCDSLNMFRLALSILVVTLVTRECLGQNLLAAYNVCRTEYNVDMDTYNAIRNGDFSIRTPFIECFGDCLVKKAGFMNDDLSFNKDVIVKFVSRFIKPEDSESVYNQCTADVAPVLCATAFDVYQCIYENALSKWGTKRNGK